MAGDSNKDPLLSNKVAGAVLAALLLVFGLPQLTKAIFGGGHGSGHGEELHLAYCCVELETAATGDTEEEPMDLGTMMAEASMSAGERRVALCKSCHTFEEGGANGTGPNLWDVVGRGVGTLPGFNYTTALKEFGGVWSYERLNEYLKNSQEYVPGTSMVQRFPKDPQRIEILAYLGSLSDNPVAFPEPIATIADEATDEIEDAATEVEETAAEATEALEE